MWSRGSSHAASPLRVLVGVGVSVGVGVEGGPLQYVSFVGEAWGHPFGLLDASLASTARSRHTGLSVGVDDLLRCLRILLWCLLHLLRQLVHSFRCLLDQALVRA